MIEKIFKNFDKKLSLFLMFLSITFILLIWFTSKRTIYLVLGFLMLSAGLIWLILRKRVSWKFESDYNAFLTFNISFFIIFTISLISLYLRPEMYVRPLIYFILISFMASLIALEIWFMPSKKGCIYLTIFQIIILSINLTLSQLLLFPSLLGVDSWWHQMLVLKIASLSHIPPNYAYSKMPIFHMVVTVTSILTSLNYKNSVFLSITIPLVLISVLLTYTMGKSLFNEKIGLLAGLILVISNYFINSCICSIPTTLGSIFLLIIIFLFLKYEDKKSVLISVLLMFLLIMMIMTHTIVALILSILMFVILISYSIYGKIDLDKRFKPVSFTLAVFFLTLMLSWWIYVSGHFDTMLGLIKWGLNVDPSLVKTPSGVIDYVTTLNLSQQLFINLGTFLFFFFAISGCFYLISKKYGNFKTFLLALIGLTPLIISFTSFFTGYSIIEGRWLYIAQIFLAIPAAISISMISSFFKRKSIISIFLFGIIFSISFFMVMDNNISNIDNNQFYHDGGVRLSLTQSELHAVETIQSIYDKPIKTDNYYLVTNSSLLSRGNTDVEDISHDLYYKNFNNDSNSMILIRKEVVHEPFWLFGTVYKLKYNINTYLNEKEFSVLYDSGSVKAYYNFV